MINSSLSYHYVAYIDLLGFSAMVETDCNGPSEDIRFFSTLFNVHREITKLTEKITGLSITQFSDCVVISVPFGLESFSNTLKLIAQYQYSLIKEGILCRGGISYGKHFQESTFLFSEGLIKAYRIESEQAKYPRIVIDRDVIELVAQKENAIYDLLLEQTDGTAFLNYLDFGTPQEVTKIVMKITEGVNESPKMVQEKHRWLMDYCSYLYPEQSRFDNSKFRVLAKS